MVETIWNLPVPSTALERGGAAFQQLPGRACSLTCVHENEDGDGLISLRLLFDGVEVFKCTYYMACTVSMVLTAYDSVVELGDTEWLRSIQKQLRRNDSNAKGLRHLMIYFDEGPCYEFICRSFRVERNILKESSDG